MPEYISREAAKTIIERLRDKCGNDEMAFALNWASRLIRDTPAADVMEVVRCRECRYSEPYGLDLKCNKHSGSTKNRLGEEIGFIEWHTPHFFCSDGKRKDGGWDE